jgi:epoxyqueuosine reductase
VEACPTAAILPGDGLDATRCISYFTIELRGEVAVEQRAGIGTHVFGCDICQDVCPWNGRAPVTADPAFEPRHFAPQLEALAAITEDEFREMFRDSPVARARYSGFLRNVAIAMGNAGHPRYREPLLRLAASRDPLVAQHAGWALARLEQ